ncbi:methionine--tRNA ligase [Candidatus Woesearchaeota archaeon]|nr:methionine--tRNA ligase [Candidatus Woesearchaeota archaeon]
MTKKNYFQISTAIDYPTNFPHAGHLYEKICTDVIARWKRLQGFKVHFSTGLDEFGSKVAKCAKAKGMEPQKFVDYMSQFFLKLCKLYNISYDDFIRTTEKRHEKIVNEIFMKNYDNGDIYKGEYEGLYCVDCETFYLEKDLDNGYCPIHKKPAEVVREESYFFKMSKYQERLIKYIKENPSFIRPEKKRNEMLNRLKEPLRDLSVSRTSVDWGIRLPIDKKHTNYIWQTALINYLTTVDYPNKKFKDFWPCLHIVGSDIIWHHSIIWGSFLMSAGIELPEIFVHGFVNIKGQKMSKSSGVVVDPLKLTDKYPADAIRYFLIREITFGHDGDFSEEALKERLNNELANDLGNLVSRSLTMVEKYFDGKIPKGKNELKFDIEKIKKLMENYELTNALSEIWKFVQEINRYINKEKPWENEKRRETVLYSVLDSIKIVSILLSSFIPETCEKISKQLGFEIKSLKDCKTNLLKEGKIKRGEILFKKVE